MPFLGNQPSTGYSTIVKDDFTANGNDTVFTLSRTAASANSIAVFVGNVRQEPTDAYTVNGTTLTMSAAPANGANFYVLHISGAVENSSVPASGTVGTGQLINNAVTTAKIADDQVTTAKIADDQVTSAKLANAINIVSGNSLTIDSGATITNNGTASGFGKLVQVVENSDVGTTSTNGSVNWITTTTLATITPQKSGSTFFVSVNGVFNARPNAYGSGAALFYKVNSGSYSEWLLDAGTGQEVSHIGVYVAGGSADTWFPASIQRFGSVTYTLGDTITFAVHVRGLFAGGSGSTTARWGLDASTDNVNAITIMEVN